MNQVNLPTDPVIAAKMVDAQAASSKARIDRGLVGWLFGTKDHVPNNIAGLVVAVTLLAIVYLCVVTTTFGEVKDRVAVLSPILTLFGGYLLRGRTKT